MADHNEVVERVAKVVADCLGCGPENAPCDIGECGCLITAKHTLAALRPGDSLGNGLWAAPEEPTKEMREAGNKQLFERKLWRDDEAKPMWKAMRRAAGGEDG